MQTIVVEFLTISGSPHLLTNEGTNAKDWIVRTECNIDWTDRASPEAQVAFDDPVPPEVYETLGHAFSIGGYFKLDPMGETLEYWFLVPVLLPANNCISQDEKLANDAGKGPYPLYFDEGAINDSWRLTYTDSMTNDSRLASLTEVIRFGYQCIRPLGFLDCTESGDLIKLEDGLYRAIWELSQTKSFEDTFYLYLVNCSNGERTFIC